MCASFLHTSGFHWTMQLLRVCVCMFVLVCVGTVSACDSGVVEE